MRWNDVELDFEKTLKGQTLTKIEGKVDGDEMIFTTVEGKVYKMGHSQECCENVYINDIIGDLDDLIGNPILLAEKVESGDDPEGVNVDHDYSFLWTFYKLSTIKGSVTIRWLGESSGCYSEDVSFYEVIEKKEEEPKPRVLFDYTLDVS
jgi:hypothetical protein